MRIFFALRKPGASLGFLFFLLSWFIPGYQLDAASFLDPKFEQLDIAALSSHDAVAAWEITQFNLFLYEAHALRQEIHQSRHFLDLASDGCETLQAEAFASIADEQGKGMAELTCAIVNAELTRFTNSPFRWLHLSQSALSDLDLARKTPVSRTEHWYAEGRVLFTLPPASGQNFGRSLVDLQFLYRIRSDVSSPMFWLARAYQVQGNLTKSREMFQLALSAKPPDVRAKYFFGDDFIDLKRVDDGLGYGFGPQLFVSPVQGIGLSLSVFDDRIADKDRSAQAKVSGGSRGYFGLGGSAQDRVWLSPYELSVSTQSSYGPEDFYGFGSQTQPGDITQITTERFVVSVGAKADFLDNFYFSLGWRLAQMNVVSGTAPAGIVVNAAYSGPYAELGVDTRDSAYLPRTGLQVFAKGYFPTSMLLSGVTFQEFWFGAEQYTALGLNHVLSVHGRMATTTGNVPFGEIPRLGVGFSFPGARPGRLEDRTLVAAWTEYRYRVWGPLQLLAFGSTATAASDLSGLSSANWRLGAGGGLVWQTAIESSKFIRFEVGTFAGETVVQAMGGRSF